MKKGYQEQTQDVLATFPEAYKLDTQTRFIHLLEEVSELGISVSKLLGKFPDNSDPVGKIQKVQEDFGGVLFDLFVLATQLEIDLESIYPVELEKYKKYSQ